MRLGCRPGFAVRGVSGRTCVPSEFISQIRKPRVKAIVLPSGDQVASSTSLRRATICGFAPEGLIATNAFCVGKRMFSLSGDDAGARLYSIAGTVFTAPPLTGTTASRVTGKPGTFFDTRRIDARTKATSLPSGEAAGKLRNYRPAPRSPSVRRGANDGVAIVERCPYRSGAYRQPPMRADARTIGCGLETHRPPARSRDGFSPW